MRVVVALLLTACVEPPPPATRTVRLDVRTVDEAGDPVGYVRLLLDGRTYGITDLDGRFAGSLEAEVGARLIFDVEPPTGYVVEADRDRWRADVSDGVRPLAVDFAVVLSGAVASDRPGDAELDDTVSDAAPPVPNASIRPRRLRRLRRPLPSPPPAPPAPPAVELPPTPPTPPAPPARSTWCAPLDAMASRLEATGALLRDDVTHIETVPAGSACYGEAHRLRAAHCHRRHEADCQADALEKATKRGRYRRDPTLLVALAEARARQKRIGAAFAAMDRAEPHLARLPAARRAEAYRMHAELAEHLALRAANDDDPSADPTDAVDRALALWRRYRAFSTGADATAVDFADARIATLVGLREHVGP